MPNLEAFEALCEALVGAYDLQDYDFAKGIIDQLKTMVSEAQYPEVAQ